MQSLGFPSNLWDYFVSDCLPDQCAASAKSDFGAALNWDKEQWAKTWNESVVDVSAMISRLRLDRGNSTFTENFTRSIVEVK